MIEHIDNYRGGVTRDELRKQLEVAEACREFWYKAYVRASTYAIDQIEAVVMQTRMRVAQNHDDCDAALKEMEDKIVRTMKDMFVTDGKKGLLRPLPSSVLPDGDGPKVA